MNSLQAYFALLKAYCAINVLLLPKAFKNGGYLLSPIALIISCTFEGTCAVKLSQCGNFTGLISYTDIVNRALGPKVQKWFQAIIAVVQFQFTVSQLAFVIESTESTLAVLTHDPNFQSDGGNPHYSEKERSVEMVHFLVATGVLIIFAPLTWVRKI
mmetsp:Transcript_32233/g.49316  ORF Transcript_32233/g.49316 Transcript_32233/m.49316 type:complete len:157 (+) Transcript_32233:722-1192(+)